jgi:hypothetical protein
MLITWKPNPHWASNFMRDLETDCANNIQVPILRSSASADLLNDPQAVEKALDEGFDVECSSELAIACRGCKQSGGVCGSNSTGGLSAIAASGLICVQSPVSSVLFSSLSFLD